MKQGSSHISKPPPSSSLLSDDRYDGDMVDDVDDYMMLMTTNVDHNDNVVRQL